MSGSPTKNSGSSGLGVIMILIPLKLSLIWCLVRPCTSIARRTTCKLALGQGTLKTCGVSVCKTSMLDLPGSQAPDHPFHPILQEHPQPQLMLPPTKLISSSISPFPSLGHSLDELKLHTRSGPPHDGHTNDKREG